MPRALISVSDKAHLLDFARGLAALGWDLVASGGTAKHLAEAGLDIVPIERVTRVGEMLGGRVKTLHPAIHAGILARDDQADFDELVTAGYAPIDVVVCNLYPFQATIAKPGVTLDDAIEHIDIGGVTLLRAAAKNFKRVTVITYPADYERVLAEIQQHGKTSLQLRRELANKAFTHTRDYDTAIAAYLTADEDTALEDHFTIAVTRTGEIRYGENPHQKAGFFTRSGTQEPLGGELLAGKALSYNNILDADAAWRTASAFEGQAAVAIIKHLTPCGIAVGASPEAAYPLALASDPLSAFGGVIAVNQPINQNFVNALGDLFIEVIIAPDFAEDALQSLVTKRKNCRLIRMKNAPTATNLEFRSVLGGVLIQERDNGDPAGTAWKVVTKRAPTAEEIEALKFAWITVQHVKSNAIVLAKPNVTVGIGGGLSSRVDAAELAVKKAGEAAKGSALASDAFFPFPDAIEAAAKAGITAVIQPGGALRDQQVIEAADAANIAMVFTGVRHFRH